MYSPVSTPELSHLESANVALLPGSIRLTDVSKSYRIFSRPADRLKQMIAGARRRYFEEVWAVNNVSLEIPPGACVGILGKNGAGKSTLLQIISGILQPTSGSIATSGRIAALLELGTGFNPEFTGRENVFLSSAVLGRSEEETRERFPDIEAFADIGHFIDQPVKTYSTGMLLRLAFAVSIHVDPDILIIDEALSVGDAKFQAKCFRKFEEFRERKKTILLVTHSPDLIARHCDSAVIIEGGRVYFQGEPAETVNEYLHLLFGTESSVRRAGGQSAAEWEAFSSSAADFDQLPGRPGYNREEFRWGNRDAEILDCLFATKKAANVNHCTSTEELSVFLRVRFNRDVDAPIYGLTIKSPDGVHIYGVNSRDYRSRPAFTPRRAGETVIVRFSFVPRLIAGNFLVSIGVAEQDGDDVTPLDRRYDVFHLFVANSTKSFGIADLEAEFNYEDAESMQAIAGGK